MNTSSSPICAECGLPVPTLSQHQICPACLVAQAMASRTIEGIPATASSPPPSPDEIADKFPQFEIIECLGRGGMGVVYKARQKSLNRSVAIKILAPEKTHDEKFAERFTREAHTLALLNHPNIVTVYDHGETDGLFYIVMEFVDGVHLRDLLRDGKLEPDQALAIVPPICEALQYAHDKGIVHRDIKPENLLLDRDGRVKIADFGISSLVGASGESTGTPPYMAPEQSGGPIDHRADIYALGVVLYEMLTGERPAKDVVAPSHKVQVDVRIDEIVLKALEKSPELRFSTAAEFRTQVEAAGQDAPGTNWRTPLLRPFLVFAILYAMMAAFVIFTSKALPEKLATHFNFKEKADGWMSADSYVLSTCLLPIGTLGFFGLLAWLLRRFPSTFRLNVPNKAYWMKPENRERALGIVFCSLLWMNSLLTLFFGAMHWQVVQANQVSPPTFNSATMIPILIIFFILMMVWIVQTIMSFTRVTVGISSGHVIEQGGHSQDKQLQSRWQGWDVWVTGLCLTIFGALWLIRLSDQTLLDRPLFAGAGVGSNVVLPVVLATTVLLAGTVHLYLLAKNIKTAAPTRSQSWKRIVGRTLVPAIAVALLLRTFILCPFIAVTDSAAPEVPKGSHVLVWKLTRTFVTGDLITYADVKQSQVNLGRITEAHPDHLMVQHNGRAPVRIAHADVVGKVISVYWRGIAQAHTQSPTPVPNPKSEIEIERFDNGIPVQVKDIKIGKGFVTFQSQSAPGSLDPEPWVKTRIVFQTPQLGRPQQRAYAVFEAPELRPAKSLLMEVHSDENHLTLKRDGNDDWSCRITFPKDPWEALGLGGSEAVIHTVQATSAGDSPVPGSLIDVFVNIHDKDPADPEVLPIVRSARVMRVDDPAPKSRRSREMVFELELTNAEVALIKAHEHRRAFTFSPTDSPLGIFATPSLSRTFTLRHQPANLLKERMKQVLRSYPETQVTVLPDNGSLTVTGPADLLNRVATYIVTADWPGQSDPNPRIEAVRRFMQACAEQDVEYVASRLSFDVLVGLSGESFIHTGTAENIAAARELERKLRADWPGKEAAIRKVIAAYTKYPLARIRFDDPEMDDGMRASIAIVYMPLVDFEGAPEEFGRMSLAGNKESGIKMNRLPPWF